MALVLTGRGTAVANAGLTVTSASFTPSNNSLLFAIGAFSNDGSLATGWSCSGGGLTWVQRFLVRDTNGTFDNVQVVYTASVTTGASMTVTLSNSQTPSNDHENLHLFDVTGYNTSVPIAATSATGTRIGTGAYSRTLTSPPSATSIVVGTRSWEESGETANASATPGATFTELYDTAPQIGFAGLQLQYRAGSTSTTVDWVDVIDASVPEFTSTALAFEIQADSAASSPPPSLLVGSLQAMLTRKTRMVGY